MIFRTDTATIAVFDPATLDHRKEDRPDWWSLPRNELEEINAGNMLLAGLGSDGVYSVETSSNPQTGVSALIKCVSGRIHIGAGEDLPGGGFGPSNDDGYTSGRAADYPRGVYRVTVAIIGDFSLAVNIEPHEGEPSNNYESQLMLTS
jgi:hypothetical protein